MRNTAGRLYAVTSQLKSEIKKILVSLVAFFPRRVLKMAVPGKGVFKAVCVNSAGY
jgi:hypothetical protein